MSPAIFRSRLSVLEGLLENEFNDETKEIAASLADDFNESYRAYLENRPSNT